MAKKSSNKEFKPKVQDKKEIARYELTYGVGLNEIKFY